VGQGFCGVKMRDDLDAEKCTERKSIYQQSFIFLSIVATRLLQKTPWYTRYSNETKQPYPVVSLALLLTSTTGLVSFRLTILYQSLLTSHFNSE
jgi:hypothetical protein